MFGIDLLALPELKITRHPHGPPATNNSITTTPTIMTTVLSSLLPKPKYTGEDEDIPQHAKPKGPRVVGAGILDESQVVLRVSQSFRRPPKSILIVCRGVVHHRMEIVVVGGRVQQKTLVMAALFQRFPTRSIHSTWEGRRLPVRTP